MDIATYYYYNCKSWEMARYQFCEVMNSIIAMRISWASKSGSGYVNHQYCVTLKTYITDAQKIRSDNAILQHIAECERPI